MRFRKDGTLNSNVESVWGGRTVSAGDPPLPRAQSLDMTRYSGAFPGKAYPFLTSIKASKVNCFHFWGDLRGSRGD